ncbi:MAG TPA: phosphotransferase family protein [Xanthomonadales bacterium]|nr:phosphotransferase family protein [Xanthomonadales bacterium]
MNALTLDEAALARYLEVNLDGFRGPLKATKFKGGQSNPTYLVEAASGDYVLRRKPPGVLLASAHAVDREFRAIAALGATDVPVPRALHLCRDESVIGSMFYVMSRVAGTIHWDPALPTLDAAARTATYAEIVRVLARLHAVDPAATGLADYGKPGNYFARQLARWVEQYRASETDRIDAMEHLIAWLPAHLPADDGAVSIAHGDYRIDNLVFAPGDTPRIAAILDWELSTLGHPHADLSYFCMALRLPRNPIIPGLAGVARGPLGIPAETELVDAYVAAGGRAPAAGWDALLAFNFFRLAAIAQGVKKRALQGNASSEQAAAVGAMVGQVAALGASLAH